MRSWQGESSLCLRLQQRTRFTTKHFLSIIDPSESLLFIWGRKKITTTQPSSVIYIFTCLSSTSAWSMKRRREEQKKVLEKYQKIISFLYPSTSISFFFTSGLPLDRVYQIGNVKWNKVKKSTLKVHYSGAFYLRFTLPRASSPREKEKMFQIYVKMSFSVNGKICLMLGS